MLLQLLSAAALLACGKSVFGYIIRKVRKSTDLSFEMDQQEPSVK